MRASSISPPRLHRPKRWTSEIGEQRSRRDVYACLDRLSRYENEPLFAGSGKSLPEQIFPLCRAEAGMQEQYRDALGLLHQILIGRDRILDCVADDKRERARAMLFQNGLHQSFGGGGNESLLCMGTLAHAGMLKVAFAEAGCRELRYARGKVHSGEPFGVERGTAPE